MSHFAEGYSINADLVTLIPDDSIGRMLAPAVEFKKPTNGANGLTRDLQGRLVACEGAGRRVIREETDGTITVGRRFNRPNDVVVKSDGAVYFSDPNTNMVPDQSDLTWPFAMVDMYGTPYTQALHVVERYRLLDYEAAKAAEERGQREILRIPGSDPGFARDLDYRGKGLQLDFTVEDEGVFTILGRQAGRR